MNFAVTDFIQDKVDYYEDIKLTKDFVSHIIAVSVGDGGAMGESGGIILLTDENKIYKTYENTDELSKALKHIPDCVKDDSSADNGWKYTYLGCGNGLFMIDWLDRIFYTKADRSLPESDIYHIWLPTACEIIESLNAKKEFAKRTNERRADFEIIPFNAQQKDGVCTGKIRESLCVEWNSIANNPERIVVIGINPSTAHDGESDRTMTRVCRFLDMYGFNNVYMLNLYESVSPEQSGIDTSTKTDFNKKRDILDKADIIILAWGVGRYEASVTDAASVLNDYADKLYCIKNPGGRYPAHPSRLPYESTLIPIKTADEFNNCGLHVRHKRRSRIKKDIVTESNNVIVECDIGIYKDEKFVMALKGGMNNVIKFSDIADKGIDGAIKIERTFACNVDVTISGTDLIDFLEKEYPESAKAAHTVIQKNDDIYKIVCSDLS